MQRLEGEYIVSADDPLFMQKANQQLRDVGVVVLRGLASEADLDALGAKVTGLLKAPAICGSIGYYMKDPNKKLYDAFLLGKPVVDTLTNNKIIDVIEQYHGCDVVMTEVFLKHDLGNDKVYFPYHTHLGSDRDKLPNGELGCGAMMYLHDTDVGAFCYCPGTHHWNSPHGNSPETYPPEVQEQIRSGMRRVSGKRGDFVIFDGRGFHGPEQPVPTSRTVIITDYTPVQCIRNGELKTGVPVILTDLTGLDHRQLRVLGVGMKTAIPYEKYHIRRFSRSRVYRLFSFAIEKWFTLVSAVDSIRDTVRTMRGRKLAADLQNDG
jgi:hypothetical protein